MTKIVLVEDNEINAKLIKDFLQFNGYAVMTVTNGVDVKKTVSETMPKLVLMDIQLFGISGIDAAKQIKQDIALRHIPIIAVSAFSKSKLEEYNLADLFAEYIEKPINFRYFESLIQKFMV